MDFVGSDVGFSLPRPKDYRGRVGATIPSGGIVLPAAKNGMGAITYAVSNLPVGLSFNATTRTITGTPSTAHQTRSVVLTATDASSPPQTASKSFSFHVVASTAVTTLDDWDSTGYGLNSRKMVMLVLLQSGANVADSAANVDIFSYPPRATVGSVQGGSTLADLELPGLGHTPIITRIRLHPNADRFTLNHSSIDAEGNAASFQFSDWHDAHVGDRSFWLQWRNDADQYPLSSGDAAGGGFCA